MESELVGIPGRFEFVGAVFVSQTSMLEDTNDRPFAYLISMPKKCQLGDCGKSVKSLTYPQGNLPEAAQPASIEPLALTRP